jgi:hypothetical protein
MHFWEDDEEEFHVYIPIGDAFKPSDVTYKLQDQHLKLLVSGDSESDIDGTLFSSVVKDDCFW